VPLTEEEISCDRGEKRTSLKVKNRNFIKLQQNEMQQKYPSNLFTGESIGREKNGLLYKRNLDGEFPLRQP
jgi:hypothetical protein